MIVSCNAFQGTTNLQKNRESQDAYTIENTEGLTSICVCDGAGFSEYGAIAAKKVSKMITQIMIEYYDKWKPEVIREEIAENISWELKKLSTKYGIDYKELATTIMGICLKDDGQINMLHLGDGNILVKKKGDEKLYYLSSAQNGVLRNQTFLTGDMDMIDHLRVYHSFKDPIYEDIYIITDGVNECFSSEEENLRAEAVLPVFFNCKMMLKDDCTFIRINL